MGVTSRALLLALVVVIWIEGTAFRRARSSRGGDAVWLRLGAQAFPELERALTREYASFFAPMERKFYEQDVTFVDPLTSFTGIDKYQANVDMLAGRSGLGKLLFKDASIVLHKISRGAGLRENQLQTRWTLQFSVKFLPWQPRPRFTGVSVYTINPESGKVMRQDDFWDSINLQNGEYKAVGFLQGLNDFLSALDKQDGAEMAAPELPYELLRRAATYEIRRYPKILSAETIYDQRPEGYDRLGSYAGGSNVRDERVKFYSPTLMFINDSKEGKREKKMVWPLDFELPGKTLPDPSSLPEPTIPRVTVGSLPGKTYAVTRFTRAATEVNVRGFTGLLLKDIQADGLRATKAAAEDGECIVGQFDALFSLNKRRNEAWAEIESSSAEAFW